MLINLSPVRSDKELTVAVKGDTLILNDVILDFAPMPEGSTLPKDAIESEWVVGDVSRVDGEIVITIMLPHSATASEAARFPVPIQTKADGYVELPQ